MGGVGPNGGVHESVGGSVMAKKEKETCENERRRVLQIFGIEKTSIGGRRERERMTGCVPVGFTAWGLWRRGDFSFVVFE